MNQGFCKFYFGDSQDNRIQLFELRLVRQEADPGLCKPLYGLMMKPR